MKTILLDHKRSQGIHLCKGLLLLVLACALMACTLNIISDVSELPGQPQTLPTGEVYRLVVLVQGRGADESEYGWIPLQALQDIRYRIHFPDLTATKSKNSTGILENLQRHLQTNYGPGKHPMVAYHVFTPGEFNRLSRKHLLIIQLASLSSAKSPDLQIISNILGCLSLGIIPIGTQSLIKSSSHIIDADGHHYSMINQPGPIMNSEISWFFLFWGNFISNDNQELLQRTIDARIQEAIQRIKVGFPSSNITA